MVGRLFDGVVAASGFPSALRAEALVGSDADELCSSMRVAVAMIDQWSVRNTDSSERQKFTASLNK